MPDESPKRRGRPLKNPDRGPESDAERSAAYRRRSAARRGEVSAEIVELAHLLYVLNARLWWGGGGTASPYGGFKLAEAAVRREAPRYAALLDALAAQERAEFRKHAALEQWNGPEAAAGPKPGSVLVGGRVYWLRPNGILVCEGESTHLRIHREATAWVISSWKVRRFQTRRIFARDVVLAKVIEYAAQILQASETSGPEWTPS